MAHYLRFLLIMIIFSMLVACSKHLSFSFEIPKEEIQQKLSEKFSLKPGGQEKEKSPLDMTISDPVVLLEDGKNQIGLKVQIFAEPSASAKGMPSLPAGPKPPVPAPPLPKPGGPGGPKTPPLPAASAKPPSPPLPKPHFTGTATIFASISYDPNGKALHLSNPKITNLEIAQLPEPLIQPLTQMAEKKLAEKFAEQPIPLENKSDFDKAVTTFLKSVTVKDGKLLVEIGW